MFMVAGLIAVAAIVSWLLGDAAVGGVLMAAAGGVVVTETPEATLVNPPSEVTTEDGSKGVFPEQSVTTGQAAAPEVYEPQYDKLITKVRIARTPLDQITRSAGKAKQVKAMEFKYGSVDYLPVKTKLSNSVDGRTDATGDSQEVTLTVAKAAIFNRRDLIIVDGVYVKDGASCAKTVSGAEPLKLWVKDRIGSNQITVIAVNGVNYPPYHNLVPAITANTTLIRIGKACAELDAQAPGYAIFPTMNEQYCQKFMAQVEQSTIDALTAKRFDNINLSDQEEATLADMRLGMEGVFLFGTKSKFTDPDTLRNVWTTQGIWPIADKTFNYSDRNAIKGSTEYHKLGVHSLIDICREMFTGPAAGKSNRRIVLCGSELLGEVQKVLFDAQYSTNVFKKWDLEFTEFSSVFGKLEFILAEVFDIYGHSKDGLVIDVDYLERYYLEPFGRNTIDFNAQGTRDSKAIVLREISAVVMKSPKNHARIEFMPVPADATPIDDDSSNGEEEELVHLMVEVGSGYSSANLSTIEAAIDAALSAAGAAALKEALAASSLNGSNEPVALSPADAALLNSIRDDYFTYEEDENYSNDNSDAGGVEEG